MKNLIVDYIPFEISPEQINESMKENNGKLIVSGILQRANAENQNGRIYPKEILVREANKYNKITIAFGIHIFCIYIIKVKKNKQKNNKNKK